LVDGVAAGRAPGQARELDFTPWGGAYNGKRPAETAFFHRSERFLLKHAVALDADASTRARDAARDWLATSWSLVHPWGSGGVFPNFPDADLSDWSYAYHGANYERLTRVKAHYDPDNVFHFHQSFPESEMEPRIHVLTMAVSDLERAFAFYRDGLERNRRAWSARSSPATTQTPGAAASSKRPRPASSASATPSLARQR
jgi:hypothetical protein